MCLGILLVAVGLFGEALRHGLRNGLWTDIDRGLEGLDGWIHKLLQGIPLTSIRSPATLGGPDTDLSTLEEHLGASAEKPELRVEMAGGRRGGAENWKSRPLPPGHFDDFLHSPNLTSQEDMAIRALLRVHLERNEKRPDLQTLIDRLKYFDLGTKNHQRKEELLSSVRSKLMLFISHHRDIDATLKKLAYLLGVPGSSKWRRERGVGDFQNMDPNSSFLVLGLLILIVGLGVWIWQGAEMEGLVPFIVVKIMGVTLLGYYRPTLKRLGWVFGVLKKLGEIECHFNGPSSLWDLSY